MSLLSRFRTLLNRLWNASIRRRLVLAFGSVSLLLMLGFGALLVAHQRSFLYDLGAGHAITLAQNLSSSSTSWVLANDLAGLQEVILGFTDTPDIHRAFVISPRGEVLASTNRSEVGRYFSDKLSRSLLDAPAKVQVLVDEPQLIDVAVPIMVEDHVIGWARVELTRASENANLHEVVLVGLGFALLAVLASVLVSTLLGRQLTAGLSHLMDVARAVERGRRDVRAAPRGGGEIALLSRNFNTMLESLDVFESRLERLNRLYAILSHCGDAIVRQQAEIPLFDEVCRIIVGQLPLCRAWVGGIGEDAGGWISKLAIAGFEHEYPQRARISVREDLPEGRGPAGCAVRSGKPVICNDFMADPSTAPWRELAREEGFRSVAVFPLYQDGVVSHVLGIYALEINFFDDKIVKLMEELAQSLSFALDNFKRERVRQQVESELRQSELRLRQAQQIGHLGYWEMDPDTRVMEWSDEMFRLFELEINTQPPVLDAVLDMMLDDYQAKMREVVDNLGRTPEPKAIDYGIRLPSGRLVYHHVTITPVVDDRQRVVRLRGTIQDITERKLAEEKLAQAAKVFESTSEGILITDAANNIISVNWAFESITGYSEQEALGQNPRFLASGRQDAEFYRKMWASINKKGGWQGEVWNRRHNGEIYPEWLTISVVRDAAGKVSNYVGIFSDVSDRKAVEERMRYLAHHDALTELPNRTLMLDRLEQALVQAQRRKSTLALLFLDIDHFKNINDTLGHDVGDLLLQEVARRLLDCVREQDTVSRQGGDEFVIILPETDAKGAGLVAQKMLEEIARPIRLQGRELLVTPSIGISLYPDDANDIDSLIKYADTAMYTAKQSGRGNYRFYEVEPGAAKSA